MEIHIEDLLNRYEKEIAGLTRRALLAEAELSTLKEKNDGDTD